MFWSVLYLDNVTFRSSQQSGQCYTKLLKLPIQRTYFSFQNLLFLGILLIGFEESVQTIYTYLFIQFATITQALDRATNTHSYHNSFKQDRLYSDHISPVGSHPCSPKHQPLPSTRSYQHFLLLILLNVGGILHTSHVSVLVVKLQFSQEKCDTFSCFLD